MGKIKIGYYNIKMVAARHTKAQDGHYHINGEKFALLVGSRAQVMHGTAHHTSGGLTKAKLKYNSAGRIVSSAKSTQAKSNNRLVKAGYVTQKGKFGAVKVSPRKSARQQ